MFSSVETTPDAYATLHRDDNEDIETSVPNQGEQDVKNGSRDKNQKDSGVVVLFLLNE
jgi:hypothetical protein